MKSTMNKAAVTAMSLLLSASLALPAAAALYTDISGHWAQQSIENLSQQGIITGYPTGEFKPEGRITRAEFAAMLVKAKGWNNQPVSGISRFVDVPATFWGYRPIEIVSSKGLVSGYPGGYYRPTQNITRAEAMSILVNSAGVPLPTQAEADQILRGFSDQMQIPQWARRNVAAAVQSGIFVNFPSTALIEPNQPATRAEVAVMANRMQDYLANRNRPPMGMGPTANNPMPGTGKDTPYTSPGMPGNMNYASPPANSNSGTIHGRVSVVPAQTVFTGVVTTAFSSDRSRVGDPVTMTLDRPIISAGGEIVVPQGSQAFGRITAIEPAGRTEKNAAVDLDFNRIVTPDGRTFNISAEVNAEQGLLKGGTTKGRIARTAGRTAGGAALGAGIGALAGALKSGNDKADDYALRGALLGGSVGAASAIIGKGNEVLVNPGDTLELKLRQPLTVSN